MTICEHLIHKYPMLAACVVKDRQEKPRFVVSDLELFIKPRDGSPYFEPAWFSLAGEETAIVEGEIHWQINHFVEDLIRPD